MDLTLITAFIGWCLVINTALLLFSTVAITVMQNAICRVHGKMFSIDVKELPKYYFTYLANFKLLVLIFNLTPYIALKLL